MKKVVMVVRVSQESTKSDGDAVASALSALLSTSLQWKKEHLLFSRPMILMGCC